MKTHELKTDPAVFEAVTTGAKTHEIRFNDRAFEIGDILHLRETAATGAEMKHNNAQLQYTGRQALRQVSHIQTGYGLDDGWVILSFKDLAKRSTIDSPFFRGLLTDWWAKAASEDHDAAASALRVLVQHIDQAGPTIGAQLSGSSGKLATIDVLAERDRQINVEGWAPERDDRYTDCQLAAAAATYALCTKPSQLKVCGVTAWPWHPGWWRPTTYRRNLVKAAALLLAEIERVDRAADFAKNGKQSAEGGA